MRIASLTNTPLDPALGSGKTVIAWSNGLRSFGHDVDVAAPEDYYRPWPWGKGRRLKMRLDALRLERRLLRGGYDLIEFYGAEFGWLIDQLAQAPRHQRPMLVAHTNGLELLAGMVPIKQNSHTRSSRPSALAAKLSARWLHRCDRKAFTRVDAFTAICQADVDYIIANRIQPLERCAVVATGIDDIYLSAQWNRPKNHYLVTVGSWTSRKDPDTTQQVVSRLLRTDAKLEFHVLGASEARESIHAAFHADLRNRVIIHPRLCEKDMLAVLSVAKVFFFPSLYEGFGMATTEAMACGCAVVVTPTGFGTSIRNGMDGFVCDFGKVEEMVDCIGRLLKDEGKRLQIAAGGRERVEEMTWSNQVSKLDKIYREWIEAANS